MYTFTSHADFHIRFIRWLHIYNTQRPHGWLGYIPPVEKLRQLQMTQCIYTKNIFVPTP
jgi:transposase InsO family protein